MSATTDRQQIAWLLWCIREGYTAAADRATLTNWMGDDPATMHPADVVARRELLQMADEVLAAVAALTAKDEPMSDSGRWRSIAPGAVFVECRACLVPVLLTSRDEHDAKLHPAPAAPVVDWRKISGHAHEHGTENGVTVRHSHFGGNLPHGHDPETGFQVCQRCRGSLSADGSCFAKCRGGSDG
jgi:hypothetical protein